MKNPMIKIENKHGTVYYCRANLIIRTDSTKQEVRLSDDTIFYGVVNLKEIVSEVNKVESSN